MPGWEGSGSEPPGAALFDRVHVVAFNRPGYATAVLDALAGLLPRGEGAPSLHVWIDGYAGSSDQQRGEPDRREAVAGAAARALPEATIHRLRTNVGVARIFAMAERLSLRRSKAPYSLFFEDDYVPGRDYLRALELLMRWGLEHPEVAIVTAHGIVAEHGNALQDDLPEQLPLRPLFPHSLWAFAIKHAHLRERAPLLGAYLATMRGVRYHARDHRRILEWHASSPGTFVPGTSQDYAKHRALLIHERLAITVPLRLGRYIGRVGEHSTEASYERLGYGRLKEETFDPVRYRRALALPLDGELLRWSRRLELLLIQAQHQGGEERARREEGLQAMAALNADLTHLRQRLAAAEQELAEAHRQMAEAVRQMADAARHMAEADQERRELRESLRQLRNSRSQRLTAPLRWCAEQLRSLPGRVGR